eukprot:352577-Chlamydomonas_euryale.AAC.3
MLQGLKASRPTPRGSPASGPTPRSSPASGPKPRRSPARTQLLPPLSRAPHRLGPYRSLHSLKHPAGSDRTAPPTLSSASPARTIPLPPLSRAPHRLAPNCSPHSLAHLSTVDANLHARPAEHELLPGRPRQVVAVQLPRPMLADLFQLRCMCVQLRSQVAMLRHQHWLTQLVRQQLLIPESGRLRAMNWRRNDVWRMGWRQGVRATSAMERRQAA